MEERRLDTRSERLAARIDALGEALREGRVPDEAAARVLAKASAAVLQALTLESLLTGSTSVSAAALGRAPHVAETAPRDVPLAA